VPLIWVIGVPGRQGMIVSRVVVSALPGLPPGGDPPCPGVVANISGIGAIHRHDLGGSSCAQALTMLVWTSSLWSAW
jgi:hypothetical protein